MAAPTPRIHECAQADVIVHRGDGTFDIYGYPKACFPPTDFHTATLVDDEIYIIGGLGYRGERKFGETQVYRLNTNRFDIELVKTSGTNPGWVYEHDASYHGDGIIRIRGGKVCVLENGAEKQNDNSSNYVLDLSTLEWSKRETED